MWIRVTTVNEYTGKEVEQLINMDWTISVGPFSWKPDTTDEFKKEIEREHDVQHLRAAKSILGVNTEGDSYNVYLKEDLEAVHRKMLSAQARAITPQS